MAGQARLLALATRNPRGVKAGELRDRSERMGRDLRERREESLLEFSATAFRRLLYESLDPELLPDDDALELAFWRAHSGRLPFGHRAQANPEATRTVAGDRSPLVEHEEEQRVLRRILNLRSRGLGARRIARTINGMGKNPRTGRQWTPSAVEKLLGTADRRATLAA